MRVLLSTLLVVAASLARPSAALAQSPTDEPPAAEPAPPPIAEPLAPPTTERTDASTVSATGELITERREVPDYDGREDPGPDAGDVLIWIPRILFGPITLVLDYGIRRPLGLLMTTAEREAWDAFLFDLFTWNERKSGIVPTFFVAFGIQPSVGLSYWSNDEIAEGHQLRLSAAFGGVDFLNASGAYRITSHGGRTAVGVRGGAQLRPDNVYSGIGWDAVSTQYRFREESYRGSVHLDMRYWRESTLRLEAGVDGHAFDTNGYVAFATNPGNQSLSTGIQDGVVERPPGLEGYVAYRQRIELSLDTREREPAPGHGVRVQAHAELAFDLNEPTDRQWLRYGGGVGGFLDVGARRVFGLWLLTRFSDPVASQPVPFTELVELGQEHLLMQGFLRGQLRGRSAVAATLEYTYPVWTRLDARLHVSLGNVFGDHLQGFSMDRLRVSFGLGIATVGDPDNAFQLGAAAGTAPLVQGAGIDSVQLVFGSRQGF